MTQTLPEQIPLSDLPLSADEIDRASQIDFEVDRDAEIPLGTQLDWRVRGMMALGVLRVGDRLPSVRELASFAGVNVNTARALYEKLERDGLISSEHGRGTFVADAAAKLGELGEAVQEVRQIARDRELDHHVLAAAVYGTPSAKSGAAQVAPFPELDPGLGEAGLRRALREQIGRLEAELAAYAWDDPRSPAPPRPRGSHPVARIVSTEELERTRGELIDRLRRLRGEAAKVGDDQAAARVHVEDMLQDPAAHRWELVTSEDAGEVGCKSWHVVPAWGPLGKIMGWWRVKVSSGCPLPGPLAAAPRGLLQRSGRGGDLWSDQ